MLGINNFNYIAHKKTLESFFLLAKNGKTLKGDSKGHTDGWGIAYYKGNKLSIYKSGKSVLKEKNKYFSKLKKIGKSGVLIVHFRKSSWKDTNASAHAHPFGYKNISLGHNGTVYDYKKLLNHIPKTFHLNSEALDSEVYFYHILSYALEGLKKALLKSSAYIRKNNKYSSLTALLSDGRKLFAYRQYSKSPDYYTLYHSKLKNTDLVSSEPLAKTGWSKLSKNKIYVY
jgi:predicted glutamine amidotransferase